MILCSAIVLLLALFSIEESPYMGIEPYTSAGLPQAYNRSLEYFKPNSFTSDKEYDYYINE